MGDRVGNESLEMEEMTIFKSEERTRFRFQLISNSSIQLLNLEPGRTPLELCWGSYSGFTQPPWRLMERISHHSCSQERSRSLDRLSYVKLPHLCPELKMHPTPPSWTDTSVETQTVKPTVTLAVVTRGQHSLQVTLCNPAIRGGHTDPETPPIPLTAGELLRHLIRKHPNPEQQPFLKLEAFNDVSRNPWAL